MLYSYKNLLAQVSDVTLLSQSTSISTFKPILLIFLCKGVSYLAVVTATPPP